MQRRTLILIIVIILILLCLFLIYWLFGSPPQAVDDVFETAVNTAVSDNVLTNDTPDGQLTVTIPPEALPTNGTLDLQSTGEFTYTPNLDFAGSDTFTYKACRSIGLLNRCDTAVVAIAVKIDAVDDTVTTMQNQPQTGNVLTNDLPPGQLTAVSAISTTDAGGSFDLQETGDFTYTPATDHVGSDTVSYQACLSTDPTNCDTATVMITVTTLSPDGEDDAIVTMINTATSGNVLANDLPPGELAATAFTTITPAGGTFELTATGDFTYTPAADYEGLDEVSYEACWILNPSVCDTTVVAITVSNIYVVAIDDSVETEKNQDASGNVLDNDSGSGPISADPTLVAPAAHGNFALAEDGTFTYAPNTDYVGPDNVTYEVCLTDNEEICKEAIVSIEVVDPGGTLVAVDDDYEIEKNQPVSGNVLDNDISPDGELTASSDEFDLSSNGAFTYTPEADFVGTVTFNYQACLASDASKCDTAVVTIIVKDGDKPEDPVKHTVQKGEWLLQIARCYGTSPESIVHANHIRYPSWIMPGEVWVIPHVGDVSEPFNDGACIIGYKAEAGDTLESIADEYKVDLDMLVKANYGCYGYHSMYPNKQYGYDMHSPQIYSGCYFPTVPDVHEGQQLVIPVNNENKGLRP